MIERPTVFIVDDDPSSRKGLSRLIQAAGMRVQTYGSARDFLDRDRDDRHGCIVLDVRMPELSGLDLQTELISADNTLPIVFVSGHAEVPEAAVAMKKGAVDFLTKPIDRDHFLKVIAESLEKDLENRRKLAEQAKVQKRITALTPRENTILRFVISGMLNKQIAYTLGITEDTVKIHRGRVMKKMGAGSLAELVRLCEIVALEPAEADES